MRATPRVLAALAATLIACGGLDEETGPEPGPEGTHHYEGIVTNDGAHIVAFVYTPNTCFYRWAPTLGCVEYTDDTAASCRSNGEWGGWSTENGVTEIAFLAGGMELQSAPPDLNNYAVLPLATFGTPDAMSIRGNAGEMLIDLRTVDPVAPAQGSYTSSFNGSRSRVAATWTASAPADRACVTLQGAVCCAPDTGALGVEAFGDAEGVGLQRFAAVDEFRQGASVITTWQFHGTALDAAR